MSSLVFSIIIIFLSLILLMFFSLIIYMINKKIVELPNASSNLKSQVVIDTVEKVVYIKPYDSKKSNKTKMHNLENFVYMISLNHDSKDLREVLKLINNNSTILLIKEKLKTLNSTIPFFLKYENKKSLVIANINIKDQENLSESFNFQITESFLHYKNIDDDFLTEKSEPKNDDQLYSTILKEVKQLKTKGWILVKISPKEKVLPIEKDFDLNIMQLTKLKWILKQNEINSYISNMGELFIAAPAIRGASNQISVQKKWINNINVFLNNNSTIINRKNSTDYIDPVLDNLNINTIFEPFKDSKNVNLAIIKIMLLDKIDSEIKYNKNNLQKVFLEAEKIDKETSKLSKILKEENPPIKKTYGETVGKRTKTIIEYSLNYDDQNLFEFIKYSFKYKKEIIQNLITYANKEAIKDKDSLIIFNFDVNELDLLYSIVKNIKRRDNFYINIFKTDIVTKKTLWRASFEKLALKGWDINNLIINNDKENLNLIRASKPKNIFFLKSSLKLSIDKYEGSEYLLDIEKIKERTAKILILNQN